MPTPDGQRVAHAELQMGGSKIYLCDEFPEMGGGGSPKTLGGTPVTIHLYVDDADRVINPDCAPWVLRKEPRVVTKL